jgi:hypothetical protein
LKREIARGVLADHKQLVVTDIVHAILCHLYERREREREKREEGEGEKRDVDTSPVGNT